MALYNVFCARCGWVEKGVPANVMRALLWMGSGKCPECRKKGIDAVEVTTKK